MTSTNQLVAIYFSTILKSSISYQESPDDIYSLDNMFPRNLFSISTLRSTLKYKYMKILLYLPKNLSLPS